MATMHQGESVQDIINIASTAEALAVSLLGAALAHKGDYVLPDGTKGLSPALAAILRGAQAEEKAHYDFLVSAGAKPLTLTFNIPDPKLASDYKPLFSTIESLESAFIAAYMAAAREFAVMKQPDLVKVALQTGGVECEHRVLARVALGENPPNNLGFEVPMFNTVGDAAAALQKLGFIGGTGAVIHFNDFAGTVDNTGVENLQPGGVKASLPSQAMPATLPHTGGPSIVPVVAIGAGLAALGLGSRKATS
ncbi:MAG TPA: ferritin-like domain-containing protein [Chloroflexota bacterium]|nr:ferritin-like domain-containing protein [Chloroflexota bacterium]